MCFTLGSEAKASLILVYRAHRHSTEKVACRCERLSANIYLQVLRAMARAVEMKNAIGYAQGAKTA